MLDAAIARYEVTSDSDIKHYVNELIEGLIINGTVSEDKGFIVRCVAPSDGKSYYIDSSRDQYTHWIYAAHILLSSSLATDGQKEIIKEVLVNIAKKAERDVKPENNGCMCRVDGKPGIVSAMDSPLLKAHEILRLPMIYAAAYEASKDEYWLSVYHSLRDRFLSLAEEKYTFYYLSNVAKKGGSETGAYQHQYSARLLYDVETDPAYKERYKKQLEISADAASEFIEEAYKHKNLAGAEEPIRENWRNAELWDWEELRYCYRVPLCHWASGEGKDYALKWKSMTNATISMVVKCLCPDYSVSKEEISLFYEIIANSAPEKANTEWIMPLCEAYWLMRKNGIC